MVLKMLGHDYMELEMVDKLDLPPAAFQKLRVLEEWNKWGPW